ncbi:MAG: hypothetical protein ACI977_000890 [Candidatus Nanohaloarchaea archaeon]
MTNWQKVSNFFLDIGLERPEAVVVDRTSRELRDLYNHSDHGNASSFHIIAEGMDLPEYHKKGVLVYDEEADEPAFYQNFQEQDLDEEEREEIEKLIPENLDSRQVSLSVDAYNQFDVNLPSNDYIENTNFTQYENILQDHYRFGKYQSGTE